MDLIQFNLDEYPAAWIRNKVTDLLEDKDMSPSDLVHFERGDSLHFVMGSDKQGMLWTTPGALTLEPAQYLSAVTYHSPAMQTETMVHGGAITAVIDAFAAGCGAAALKFPMAIATAEQTVKFRRPVGLNQPYLLHCWHEVEAVPVEARAYTADIAGELIDEEGTVVAQSRSIIKVPRAARGQS